MASDMPCLTAYGNSTWSSCNWILSSHDAARSQTTLYFSYARNYIQGGRSPPPPHTHTHAQHLDGHLSENCD